MTNTTKRNRHTGKQMNPDPRNVTDVHGKSIKTTTRLCMRCQIKFQSWGIGNRMCVWCRTHTFVTGDQHEKRRHRKRLP